MSAQTENYLAELEAVEAEADAYLGEADPEGQDRGLAVTRQLRATVKRYRRNLEQMRAEAMAEARQALITERQAESSFRRLGVPASGRALFSDVDPTDFEAMAARADELREAGISWPGMPQAPAPPPPDPRQVELERMQMAGAGGTSMESAGDLATRLKKMGDDPGAYTDAQRAAAVQDFNRAVDAAARPSWGANGA
jgi:hypothetical protein